jgi:hypothetical protein
VAIDEACVPCDEPSVCCDDAAVLAFLDRESDAHLAVARRIGSFANTRILFASLRSAE